MALFNSTVTEIDMQIQEKPDVTEGIGEDLELFKKRGYPYINISVEKYFLEGPQPFNLEPDTVEHLMLINVKSAILFSKMNSLLTQQKKSVISELRSKNGIVKIPNDAGINASLVVVNCHNSNAMESNKEYASTPKRPKESRRSSSKNSSVCGIDQHESEVVSRSEDDFVDEMLLETSPYIICGKSSSTRTINLPKRYSESEVVLLQDSPSTGMRQGQVRRPKPKPNSFEIGMLPPKYPKKFEGMIPPGVQDEAKPTKLLKEEQESALLAVKQVDGDPLFQISALFSTSNLSMEDFVSQYSQKLDQSVNPENFGRQRIKPSGALGGNTVIAESLLAVQCCECLSVCTVDNEHLVDYTYGWRNNYKCDDCSEIRSCQIKPAKPSVSWQDQYPVSDRPGCIEIQETRIPLPQARPPYLLKMSRFPLIARSIQAKYQKQFGNKMVLTTKRHMQKQASIRRRPSSFPTIPMTKRSYVKNPTCFRKNLYASETSLKQAHQLLQNHLESHQKKTYVRDGNGDRTLVGGQIRHFPVPPIRKRPSQFRDQFGAPPLFPKFPNPQKRRKVEPSAIAIRKESLPRIDTVYSINPPSVSFPKLPVIVKVNPAHIEVPVLSGKTFSSKSYSPFRTVPKAPIECNRLKPNANFQSKQKPQHINDGPYLYDPANHQLPANFNGTELLQSLRMKVMKQNTGVTKTVPKIGTWSKNYKSAEATSSNQIQFKNL